MSTKKVEDQDRTKETTRYCRNQIQKERSNDKRERAPTGWGRGTAPIKGLRRFDQRGKIAEVDYPGPRRL